MKAKWIILIVAALISPFLALNFGAATLDGQQVWDCLLGACDNSVNDMIFWDIRFPRVLVGLLVGAGLAVAGAILQNTTRNNLADPYLFGVMSGAGLGASVATLLLNSRLTQSWGLSAWADNITVALPVAAFLGALFAVVLVQALAISAFWRRAEHMLLAGVAVSYMLTAASQFLLFVGDPFAANQVIFWLMGSLARADTLYPMIIAPVLVVSLCLLLLYGRHLDAMLLGDETAKTLGVKVTKLRFLMLGICAALTGCIVAYCGGIVFVGLMIPHIIRRWIGVTTRTLVMGSALLGGVFIIWVDVLARSAFDGQEIPIGIITSAVGSVFFLFVMRKRQS